MPRTFRVFAELQALLGGLAVVSSLVGGGLASWRWWQFPWTSLLACGGYWFLTWLAIVIFRKHSKCRKWLKNKWRGSLCFFIETLIIAVAWFLVGIAVVNGTTYSWESKWSTDYAWNIWDACLVVALNLWFFFTFLLVISRYWPWIFLTPLGVWFFYNRLKRQENACQEARSNINTELRRRQDLYDKAIELVRGYAQHERRMLVKLAQLRSHPPSQVSFRVIVEGYPELKAHANFMALQEEIVRTENRIEQKRLQYNQQVKELNDSVDSFPSSGVARRFGIKKMRYFQFEGI
jgi:LemA protein